METKALSETLETSRQTIAAAQQACAAGRRAGLESQALVAESLYLRYQSQQRRAKYALEQAQDKGFALRRGCQAILPVYGRRG